VVPPVVVPLVVVAVLPLLTGAAVLDDPPPPLELPQPRVKSPMRTGAATETAIFTFM
jgi:hypothetical protein